MAFYNTTHLTLEQKVDILHRAKGVCYHWCVDVLDCSKSFCRQPIEMSFEDIMAKYDGSHLAVSHRCFPPDNYLEIGFRTNGKIGEPDYFLWLFLDVKYIPDFTTGLEVT